MKEQINILKERFGNATTKVEIDAITREMDALATADNDAFSEAMVELASETADRAGELVLREHLQDILPVISLAYIAKTYFKKSRSWLHQRINGWEVNGKPARFTPEEVEVFNHALQDISHLLASKRVSS